MDLRCHSHRICFEYITNPLFELELNKRPVGHHRVTCFMQCYHYFPLPRFYLITYHRIDKFRFLKTAAIQRDRGKNHNRKSPNKLILRRDKLLCTIINY